MVEVLILYCEATVTLAGEQGDIDFLDHLDTVQHFGERSAAQRLRGIPHGGVWDTRPLRLEVEHIVTSAH